MATYSGSDKRLQYLFNASGNLADDYDPTNGTYAVGDFAMIDGVLKKCNTAITTPEAYDSSKWDDVLITEEMGGGGGGGTTVIANPTGTPTDELDTIQIGSTIYDIVGGGSSGEVGMKKDVLWENSNGQSFSHASQYSATLSKNISDYDIIVVSLSSPDWDVNRAEFFTLVSNIDKTGTVSFGALDMYGAVSGGYNSYMPAISYVDETHLNMDTASSASTLKLYKIVGLKISSGSGGGGGAFIDTSNIIEQDTITAGAQFSYTATEDCFFIIHFYLPSNFSFTIYIDGVAVQGYYLNVSASWQYIGNDQMFPLKKDQVISFTYPSSSPANANYSVFGMQGNGGGGNTNSWTGTQAELEEVFDELEDGTQINITDDLEQTVIASYDIYSDEEREVGVWRDGKPLYQKTITINNPVSDTSWHNVSFASVGLANVDKCVEIKGVIFEGGANASYSINSYRPAYTIGVNLNVSVDNEIIMYMNNWLTNTASGGVIYVTLKYTKTTDVAGQGLWLPSGEKAHHYSTDEQVVGTYFGETLYEKTIYVNGPFTMGNNYQITHDLTGIERIVDMDGSYYDVVDSRDYALPNLRQVWSESVYIAGFVPSNHVPIIALQSGGYNYGNVKDVSITVRYTKVSS